MRGQWLPLAVALVLGAGMHKTVGAQPATCSYIRLDALVVLYTTVIHDGKLCQLDNVDMQELRRHVDAASLFYWRNSGMRFHLRPHYVICPEPVAFDDWWLPDTPAWEAVSKTLAAAGDSADRYDSLLAIWADPAYDPTRRWRIDDCWGGAGTVHRFSSFPVINSLCWMVVHEFHHQLDMFFAHSGFDEYAFNHPTGLKWEGKSGNHFDVNASILRAWPRDRWLALAYGKRLSATDADQDGVPDDDPEVPLNEVLLGSDATRVDSDGDGLDDLGEAMAGIFTGSNPRDPDTDRDGLADGPDPYPLHPLDERIPYRPPDQAGSTPLLSLREDRLCAEIYLDWNETGLTLRGTVDRPARVHVFLDGRDDGRWRGADNYELSMDLPAGNCELRIWDARPGYFDFDTSPAYAGGRRLILPDELAFESHPEAEGASFRLRFPHNDLCGPHLAEDSTLGLALEFVPLATENLGPICPFERWHFVTLKLVRDGTDAPHLPRQGGFGKPFMDEPG